MKNQRTLIGAGLLAATLLLAGCSAGGGYSSDQPGGAPISGPAVAEDSAVDSDGSLTSEEAEREVIVTGTMTLTTEKPADAAREAARIVEAAGGRVDARSEYAPANGDLGSATLTLRIPSEKLQSVIDDLTALGVGGTADEVSTFTQDVTAQQADLASRIATQRAIIERLNALFGTAATIQDLIELETRIAQHQSELENLEAQQRSTDDLVALSTLDLYLRSVAAAPAAEPLDFLTGLQTGWGAFVGFFSGLLVALGVLLPWLITIALITAIIIVVVRRRRVRTTHS